MYVWFDALNIYQSGIGFGWDETLYKKWWPADVHVIGKGIIRFHAVYWPAFLLSAKLELPKKLFVHEYFTVNGQKMSKTLGNVIDPMTLIEKYGADALRFYFLKHFSPFSDGDFSEEKFKEAYNADLANGLGNLVARVAKLCENKNIMRAISRTAANNKNQFVLWIADPTLEASFRDKIEEFEFNEVLALVWQQISKLDHQINDFKPWNKDLNAEEVKNFLGNIAANSILDIARLLQPFMPETAEKIIAQFTAEKIVSGPSLFPRIV